VNIVVFVLCFMLVAALERVIRGSHHNQLSVSQEQGHIYVRNSFTSFANGCGTLFGYHDRQGKVHSAVKELRKLRGIQSKDGSRQNAACALCRMFSASTFRVKPTNQPTAPQ
jgi:hypothetical protein